MKISLLLCSLIFTSLIFAQPTSWESRGIGGGGSLFHPTISPHNSNEIYMQCDMTEVFHTTTLGQNWAEIHFEDLISTGGLHTVEFTSDPTILYTVNYNFLTDAMFPVKSTDAGLNWSAIADPTGGDCWFISADPNTTNRILISSYTELYISLDGGTTFNSVYDNGSDFHIAGVFWDGDDIYVGTQADLIVSSNGGTSFSLDAASGIPTGEGLLSFTGAKENGTVQLMATTAGDGDLYPGVNALDIDIYSEIIEYQIGSGGWVNATTGIATNHDLFYIASSQIDNSTFYVGGTDNGTSYPVVYKTTNGGTSWSEVFLPVNNSNVITGWSGYNGDEDWWYGEIVFGLAVAPNDPDVLIYTDFGFAHLSDDGGSTWRQAYVESTDQNPAGSDTPIDQSYAGNGLENTSAWQLTWIDSLKMFGSYTDITGIRSVDGGSKWAFDYSGINYNTVYDVLKHPTTGTLFAAVSSVHDLYQSTYLSDGNIDGGSGGILYSTDEGVNWNMLEDFGMPVIWLALDPNDSDVMYASVVNSNTGGIYKTVDLNNLNTASWSQTTSPTRTEGHPYNVEVLNDGTVVSTWCAHRDPGFTASSGVFSSSDGGTTWDDVSMDDEMHYWTKDICIDPNDVNQNTWYVAVHSGWGGAANNKGGLYRTTDRGTSWTLVFDSYRVESATVHPTNPDIIYATTEFEGLWYADNGSSALPTFNVLNAYSFQHPLRVVFDPYDVGEIWITSFGNGLKVSSTTTGGGGSGFDDLANRFVIYPNPANEIIYIKGTESVLGGKLMDAAGRIVYQMDAGDKTLDVSSLKAGIYFLIVESANGEKSNHKILVE